MARGRSGVPCTARRRRFLNIRTGGPNRRVLSDSDMTHFAAEPLFCLSGFLGIRVLLFRLGLTAEPLFCFFGFLGLRVLLFRLGLSGIRPFGSSTILGTGRSSSSTTPSTSASASTSRIPVHIASSATR